MYVHAKRRFLQLFILVLLASLAACGTSRKASVGEGQYRVVRGDTLTKIARQHGQTVDSLMRMNNLRNANHIRVGQVLRVQSTELAAAPPSGDTRTVQPPAAASGKLVAAPRAIKLVWPAKGNTQRGATTATSQGVYINAAAGTPVHAAAAGEVVYAGDGLRGYGNLLLIKHDDNFLTVYAHNERLLVKEGARVKQGQEIATVGSTGRNAVALYFELRYDGKPVDAMRYLPT